MLVLSRKKEEAIVVTAPGGSAPMLKVTVLETGSGGVRLGFEAPTDVLVHRWEVWEKILARGPPNGQRPALLAKTP